MLYTKYSPSLLKCILKQLHGNIPLKQGVGTIMPRNQMWPSRHLSLALGTLYRPHTSGALRHTLSVFSWLACVFGS